MKLKELINELRGVEDKTIPTYIWNEDHDVFAILKPWVWSTTGNIQIQTHDGEGISVAELIDLLTDLDPSSNPTVEYQTREINLVDDDLGDCVQLNI